MTTQMTSGQKEKRGQIFTQFEQKYSVKRVTRINYQAYFLHFLVNFCKDKRKQKIKTRKSKPKTCSVKILLSNGGLTNEPRPNSGENIKRITPITSISTSYFCSSGSAIALVDAAHLKSIALSDLEIPRIHNHTPTNIHTH